MEVFRDPTRGMATLGSMEAGVQEEGTRSMVVVLEASSGLWITGQGHGSDSRQLPIPPWASSVEMGGSQQQLHVLGMAGASQGEQPQGQHTIVTGEGSRVNHTIGASDHSKILANMCPYSSSSWKQCISKKRLRKPGRM
jgi:hypothetical protein